MDGFSLRRHGFCEFLNETKSPLSVTGGIQTTALALPVTDFRFVLNNSRPLIFPMHLSRVCLLASLTFLTGVRPLTAQDAVNPWGIASSASGAGDMNEWMPEVVKAGAGTVRMWPEWGEVEPRDGAWKWDKADAILHAAKTNGLRVNGILMGSVPGSKGGSHAFPMSDLDGWSEYVRETVKHTGGTVQHWEVWNEGNGGFNDGKHTTADYARLASAAYAAAKQADPAVQIALTTASYDPAYLGRTIMAQKADGGKAAFDFLCVHPYELADAVGQPGGEVPFLWMSHLLRETLKRHAPEKTNADIWITEVGRNIARRKDQPAAEREAAAALIKIYTLSFAQGIRCVQWFEGRDPAGEEPGFGLLKRDGSPRLSYHAFQRLAATLGKRPRFTGWLALNDTYGFIFQGASEPVLVIWKDAGAAEQEIQFKSEVEVTTPLDGATRKVTAVKVGNDPLFIRGLPADVLTTAKSNAAKPWPWGGNHASAKTVSAQPGASLPASGVSQCGSRDQPRVTFPDGGTGILLSANEGVRFCVHPSFASIHQQEYYVRVTVRRITPGNVGMNLHYEIADTQGRSPIRNAGTWFGLNESTDWQTFTWHVKDACFAKMWGYDFAFAPEQSQPFVIGKVEVSTEAFPPVGR
jgi:hypothetical protein